ncbi:hypothetical protein H9P43_004687 [Blastocladiella emersonii ATCC 22665]|nr:hypothetical protein H9P43_004687 [Blastocladiella emersonii ATCC 22665]
MRAPATPRAGLLAAGLLAAALIAVLVGSARAAEYKLGLALPLTGPDRELVTAIKEVIELGMEDVNAWARTDFAGNTFSLKVYDTQDHESAAVAAMFDASRTGILGMIGEFDSSPTIPMALAGNQFNMWQCSGSVTTPTLSDKSEYQRFFRTLPADHNQGAVLAYWVRNMGWRSCAILAVSNSYGEGITQRFLQTASEVGIRVETVQSFTPSNNALSNGYKVPIDGIKNSGTRIVLFFGSEGDLIDISKEARKQGIMGNKEWVWIGSDGIATIAQDSAKARFTAAELSVTDGMFYPFFAEKGASFLSFLDRYKQKYKRSDTPFFGTTTLDCAHGLARGLAAMTKRNGENATLSRDYRNASIKDFLVNFTSPTTGTVNFDANGDRVGPYYVYNVFGGKMSVAYTVDAAAKSITPSPDYKAKFFGGSTDVPLDRPVQSRKYPVYTDFGAIIVLALTAILAITIVATVGYLFVHRGHSNVKNMSLPFVVMIAVGLLFVLASTVLWIGEPSAATCGAGRWTFALGYELVVSATAAKSFRIYAIFDNSTLRKLNKLTNSYLLLGCSLIVAVQIGILVVWSVIAPLRPRQRSTFTSYYFECASDSANLDQAFYIVSLVYNGLLLVVVSYLAYKTRKAYSAFRESRFIFYSVQNIFLSGLVVSPFLFIVGGDFNLGAYYIRSATILYAVGFTYACLVGRIALGLYMAITKSSNTGVKMNLSNGGSSSGGGISTGEVMPGKPQTMAGKYPIKLGNRLFETWHTHRLTLFALEGYLGMTRLTNNTEQGKLFKLRSIQFDPTPSAYPLCIEIRADSTSYIVQFNKEDDKAKWVRALSVHCLVMSKSSANKSTMGPNGLSTAGPAGTLGGGAATSRMQFSMAGAHGHGATSQITSQYGGGFKSTNG